MTPAIHEWIERKKIGSTPTHLPSERSVYSTCMVCVLCFVCVCVCLSVIVDMFLRMCLTNICIFDALNVDIVREREREEREREKESESEREKDSLLRR